MPNILKLVSHHFIVYPFSRLDIRRRPPTLHPLTLSQFPHGNYFAMHRPHSVSIWLEAAYDPSITNQTRLELWVIERNSGRLLLIQGSGTGRSVWARFLSHSLVIR